MLQNGLKILCLLPGALLMTNAIIATCLSNLSTGIWLTYAAGAVFLAIGLFFTPITSHIPKLLGVVFLLVVVLTAGIVTGLYAYGTSDSATYREEALIVLGAGIHGETVSATLQNRLDSAVTYYAANPDAVLVVSGGQGPQEDIPEAEAMARYLIERGIPEDCIIKEVHSTSTVENFVNSKALLDARFDTSYTVAFISNDFHIYRAQAAAKRAGFDTAAYVHSTTPWYTVIPNGLREILAILKFWIVR